MGNYFNFNEYQNNKFKEEFDVLEYLGAGTFGGVFKNETNSTFEKYALKIIKIITDDKEWTLQKTKKFL
jgi:serine/threonine protein kinase